ncbi:MAG: flagellar basal body rod protein FlgB [Nitrospinae bacterium]|nr:flagellar basal body rod protein FlgB [Nitrospinota bacterium]
MGLINDLLYTNKTGQLAKKALDLYDQRFQLANSNVANAETPGYKAVDLKPFEQDLQNAYRGVATLKTTHPGHVQGNVGNLDHFSPEMTVSTDEPRIDGNNVDMDKETVKMVEIGTMYQAVMAARSKRGAIISGAVEGGGQ